MADSVCGICLAGNVRMQNIQDTHLQEIYEKLTPTKLHTEGETSTVCYVCYRELQNAYTFLRVAHESSVITQDLLLKGSEVTHSTAVNTHVPRLHNLCIPKATTHMSVNVPHSNTECTPDVILHMSIKKLVKVEE